MELKSFWTALGRWQRVGFVSGLLVIVALTSAVAAWALRDPWVAIATQLPAERVVALTRELTREKVEHRIAEDGASVEVRQSAAGRARAAAATGGVGLPSNVGLEIFKETDFSTTDFAQRVNYQRALQGEITRTLQTISGVRQARVHVVLPESSVLKRGAAKASAAVTLALAPGKSLSRGQIRGVQRLVAASVPEIKADEVVVLDEGGASLTRDVGAGETELSTSQLDLKRQVDAYLEAKLMRLMEDLAPGVQVALSVDTLLDYKHLRVTVDEPIAAKAAKDDGAPTGVVSKERQLQRTTGAAGANTASVDSSDFEFEYKVGHRVEQTLLGPGTVRRISVAVALHGAPPDLAAANVESLVAHAVGVDRQRGDAVMVMMLSRAAAVDAALAPVPLEQAKEPGKPAMLAGLSGEAGAGVLGLALLLAVAGMRWQRAERAKSAKLAETAEQIRQWLGEAPADGRG